MCFTWVLVLCHSFRGIRPIAKEGPGDFENPPNRKRCTNVKYYSECCLFVTTLVSVLLCASKCTCGVWTFQFHKMSQRWYQTPVQDGAIYLPQGHKVCGMHQGRCPGCSYLFALTPAMNMACLVAWIYSVIFVLIYFLVLVLVLVLTVIF